MNHHSPKEIYLTTSNQRNGRATGIDSTNTRPQQLVDLLDAAHPPSRPTDLLVHDLPQLADAHGRLAVADDKIHEFLNEMLTLGRVEDRAGEIVLFDRPVCWVTIQ